MSISYEILPIWNESPSEYADRLGFLYASSVTDDHKKNLGQFFTPLGIAVFMSELCKTGKSKIRILDPGCGIGILSIALIEHIVNENTQIKIIELVAFEMDVKILPLAENCFNNLGNWLKEKKIDFTFFLCKNDFILHNSHVLNDQESPPNETYDIVISNPPYFKLPKNDERAIAAKSIIHGQTNIYTIFLLIAARLLGENGQLIFITPRSFCSGNYFRLFREIFFSITEIKHIHLFNSRKDAFRKDKVLQENIIIAATKKLARKSDLKRIECEFEDELTISTSNGIEDIDKRRIRKYKSSGLINFDSYQKILHLPSTETDELVIDIFKTWSGSLKAYNLKISTGPVVDFRCSEIISFQKTSKTVPLFWLHNIEPMKVVWPRIHEYKGKPKGQFILNNVDSFSKLVKNRNYVLLRRFSSKEDNRRLIAAPYFCRDNQKAPMLGIENHLNYIYHMKAELTNDETFGIAALLNSQLFDLYFRTFNGNINVSATELRDFPLPEMQLIQLLGSKISELYNKGKLPDIDNLVAEVFNVKMDLTKNYG